MKSRGERPNTFDRDAREDQHIPRSLPVSVNVPTKLTGPVVLSAESGVGQISIDDCEDGVLMVGRPVYISRKCEVRLSAIFDAEVSAKVTVIEGQPAIRLKSPVVTDLSGRVGVLPNQENPDNSLRFPREYSATLDQSLSALLRGLPGRNHSNKLSLFHRLLPQLLACDLYCCQEVPNRTLAELASMSTHHFGRVFQATFGVGPADYRRSMRLRAAALLVRFSSASTSEIAFAVGYKDRTAFSRAFSQALGASPEQVRSAIKEKRIVAGNALGVRQILTRNATHC